MSAYSLEDAERAMQGAVYCGNKCADEAFNWVIAQYPECINYQQAQQQTQQPSQQTPQQTPKQQPKPQEEECENIYSNCIQQNCILHMDLESAVANLQKTCFNTCQRNVEASRGSKCALLPGKVTPWFGTGKVKSVEGDVRYVTPEGVEKQLSSEDTIPPGSHVSTGFEKAKIVFEDGSFLELKELSSLNYVNDGYRLSAGRMRSFLLCSSNQMSCPSISTPVGRFKVKGTDFILEHFPPIVGDYTVLYVKEGQVEAVSKITGESQIVNAGEKAFINSFVDREGSVDKETLSEDEWADMMEEIQIRDSALFSFLVIGCWLVGIGAIVYVIWRLVRKRKNRVSGSSDAKVNKKGFRKEDNTCKCGNKITKSDAFCPQCGRKIG
jgi:hypothetical protein